MVPQTFSRHVSAGNKQNNPFRAAADALLIGLQE